MKVIYFGTPQFAVEPLKAIVNSKHSVLAVVSQPDRAKDRKGVFIPSPIKKACGELNLPLYQYENIKNCANELSSFNADIFVTAGYGQLFSQEIIDIPKFSIINIHASILPKYRGSSPIQWAIMNDEKQTGITIMKTSLGLDSGDILLTHPLDILKTDNYNSLSNRLSILSSELIIKALDLIQQGKANYKKQNEAEATKYPLITKQMGLLDFSNPPKKLFNMIRAIDCHTYIKGKYIKVLDSIVIDTKLNKSYNFGEIIGIENGIDIACNGGALRIISVKPQDKVQMLAKDFLKGNRLNLGEQIGTK